MFSLSNATQFSFSSYGRPKNTFVSPIFQATTPKQHQITQTVPEIANYDIIVQVYAKYPPNDPCQGKSPPVSKPIASGTVIAINTPAITITQGAGGVPIILIAGGAFLIVILIAIGLLGI